MSDTPTPELVALLALAEQWKRDAREDAISAGDTTETCEVLTACAYELIKLATSPATPATDIGLAGLSPKQVELGEDMLCAGASFHEAWEAVEATRAATVPQGVSVDADVEYEFEVWQGGAWQAGGSTTTLAAAVGEASHYEMMYGQDGPVELRYYEKRPIDAATTPPPAELGEE